MTFRIRELTHPAIVSILTLALVVACGDDDADPAPGGSLDAATSADNDAGGDDTGDFPDAGGKDPSDDGAGAAADASTGDGIADPDAANDAESDDAVEADAGGSGSDETGLEIAGEFHDEFANWTFTDSTWELGYGEDVSLYDIQSFSNVDDYLVALADEDNLYDAGLFQKLMWIADGDSFYTCTATGAGVETFEDALEASADTGDLESGCGGFPWSLIEPGSLPDE